MLRYPYSDESNAETNWNTAFVLLDEEAVIQQLVDQGYMLSEQQRDRVRCLLQCKTARLQYISIALGLKKKTNNSDYRLGWSQVFLA
jgi:hypothetical protein